MTDTSTCFSLTCGHSVEGTVETCPKCGGRMKTSRHVRILGWVLLVIGLFLIGLMGTITWNLLPDLLYPEQARARGSFTGTNEQAQMTLRLFGMVIAVGAASLVNGLYQIMTGRRSRVFVLISLALAAVLIFMAWTTTRALGG
jgi:cation transport ATPase